LNVIQRGHGRVFLPSARALLFAERRAPRALSGPYAMSRLASNKGAKERILRRNRLFTLAIVILLLAPWAAYLWTVVLATRGTRIQYALNRNQATARLSARLLDEQCAAAISVLRMLAGRYPTAASLRVQNRAVVREDIRTMMKLVPDLVFAGIYQTDGKLFASYPRTLNPAADASGAAWFKEVAATKSLVVSDVARLPDERRSRAITLAVPLGREARPAGFLLAYYRPGQMENWLPQLIVEDDVRVYIVTVQGSMVADSRDSNARSVSFKGSPLLRRALQKKQGAAVTQLPGEKGDALTGFARASVPRWIVLVSQPAGAALAPANYLLLRLPLFYLPVLVLMLAAARALTKLYHQQGEMTQRLAEQNERLRAADRAKSEFLSNVSHDLWTPLAGIQFSISGLLDPNIPWKAEQVREQLQLAGEEVDQLITRVRNLLEMSRLESSAVRSQKVECDLADIVESVLERMKLRLQGRRVDVMLSPVPLLFKGRPAQFEIVLMNLLDNALKYSPPGTPFLMRGELRGRDIYFSLLDEGPGVPPGEAERIFEKFYRARPPHPQGSTGLGLAICKAILEDHDGLIGVFNPPGGGAEFWFSLPALYPPKEHG
jgi:signal transduction histidine kinase